MQKTGEFISNRKQIPCCSYLSSYIKECIKTSIYDGTECPLVDCKCAGAARCAILGCKYLWFQSGISTVEYVISTFAFHIQ
eukprot:10748275-Ditylum_brightwellii.AAC.1